MVAMWFPEQRQVWGWWRRAKQGGAGAGLHVMKHTGRTQDNSISLTSVSFDTWDARISGSVCVYLNGPFCGCLHLMCCLLCAITNFYQVYQPYPSEK